MAAADQLADQRLAFPSPPAAGQTDPAEADLRRPGDRGQRVRPEQVLRGRRPDGDSQSITDDAAGVDQVVLPVDQPRGQEPAPVEDAGQGIDGGLGRRFDLRLGGDDPGRVALAPAPTLLGLRNGGPVRMVSKPGSRIGRNQQVCRRRVIDTRAVQPALQAIAHRGVGRPRLRHDRGDIDGADLGLRNSDDEPTTADGARIHPEQQVALVRLEDELSCPRDGRAVPVRTGMLRGGILRAVAAPGQVGGEHQDPSRRDDPGSARIVQRHRDVAADLDGVRRGGGDVAHCAMSPTSRA